MNSRQLVLCLDNSSGLALVGWSVDLPPGRFDHIDIIGESAEAGPLVQGHPAYTIYEKGCRRAQLLNAALIARQTKRNLSRGWLRIAPDMAQPGIAITKDAVGSYQHSAQQTAQTIAPDKSAVWARVNAGCIMQLRSQSGCKDPDELRNEVWKHRCWQELEAWPGVTRSGQLAAEISGLWFIPDELTPAVRDRDE